MCKCIDCRKMANCEIYNPSIHSLKNYADDCIEFEDDENEDIFEGDRWNEMSYKKFIGRKCSDSLEELENELEKEEQRNNL